MYDYENTRTISLQRGTKPHSYDMPMMHTHQCHELYFLLSGQRRYLIGPDIYDVSPGNVVLIPRQQLHRTTMRGTKAHSRYVVYFCEAYVRDFVDLVGRDAFERLLAGGCMQLSAEHTQFIGDTLRKMEQEQKANGPFARAAVKTALQEILLCLLRHGSKREHASAISAEKIQEVTRYISENYSLDISLGDAAQLAFMEKTYFSKCFKKLTGFGFSEYLTRVRIQAAQQLLQGTDYSVSEIAARCGFSGSNYFGDVFRRCTGLSPTQYRNTYRS